jgi:hypothetical protein
MGSLAFAFRLCKSGAMSRRPNTARDQEKWMPVFRPVTRQLKKGASHDRAAA